MRIAIVNNEFGMGGLQRVTTVIGKALSQNHEVFFYSLNKTQNFYEIDKNFVEGESLLFKNPFLKKIWKSRRLLEQIKKRGEYTPYKYVRPNLDKLIEFSSDNKLDCLILSGHDATAYIPYLKKKLLPSIKLIAWQHNNLDMYINSYAKSFKSAYLDGLSKADCIVCLTNSDFNIYKKYNSSITRIYNPLTIENTDQISNLNNKVISFVGRLAMEHKGIDYLIEIASKLPDDWKISIAGSGDDSTMKQINKLMKKYDVKNKVVFCGALKSDGLTKHYLNSSIYIMTSRWEGFGLVLAEAMSFGLPIISFENTGSNEVLSQGKYGKLVENGNVEKIIDELILFIENEKLRFEYQKKSLERVKDFYIERIISDWEKVLLEVQDE